MGRLIVAALLQLLGPAAAAAGGAIPDSTLGLTEIAYAPDFTRAAAAAAAGVAAGAEGPILPECDRGKGYGACLGPSFYLGTPSVVRSPTSGHLLATADLFDHGPSADCWPNFFVAHREPGWKWARNATLFRSTTNGSSWEFAGWVLRHYWSSLFAHEGGVYLMGVTNDSHGAVAISRWFDDGAHWNQSELFADARYTTGATAVLFAAGRVFRAYERVDKAERSSVMVSAAATAGTDLLDPSAWRTTPRLLFDRAWIPPAWGPVVQPVQPWVEGNAVQGPDGAIYNLLRLENGWSTTRPVANKAILLRGPPAQHPTRPQQFVGIYDMPGGSSKFTVRRDPVSKRYLALTNNVTNVSACPSARNVLVLVSSADLREWTIDTTLVVTDEGMAEEDVWRYTAFSYVDWQFDGAGGGDIIYAMRTSYRGGVSFHNTNRITFKRLAGFSQYLPVADPVAVSSVPSSLGLKSDDIAATSAKPADTWIHNDVGLWNDTEAHPLHAHGGGMYAEDGQFFWTGVGRITLDRPYYDSFSIALYGSSDLGSWQLRSSSILNKTAFLGFNSPLITPAGSVVMGRPKIIKSATGRYVLWFCFISRGSGACTASSATIDGDYTLDSCFEIDNKLPTGDLTVIRDGEDHYAIADTKGSLSKGVQKFVGFSKLSASGLKVTAGDCLTVRCNASTCAMFRPNVTTAGEAPALFRSPETGKAYLWTSHLSGLAPNAAMLYEGGREGLCGPTQNFKLLGNPSLSPTTHNTQSTFIQPVVHSDNSTTLLYMSDRWCNPGFHWGAGGGSCSMNISNATYVWLPLYPNKTAPSGWSLPFLKTWRIGDPRFRIPAATAVAAVTLKFDDDDEISSPPPDARIAAEFVCSAGTIANSNRSATVAACAGVEGDECHYACDPGYLAIGRHVCQNYSTMGVSVIDKTFFGGRCIRLCGATAANWSCKPGLVPVRLSVSDHGSLCLSTTCLPPMEALRRLTRGNWEVWKLGRVEATGMYIDHVNPLVSKAKQQVAQASTDGSGPGLAMECVAASLGYQTLPEAATRVLVTLQSFANKTAGFHVPRNENGWLPTFFDSASGKCLFAKGSECAFSTDSTAFGTTGVLFVKTFFEREDPNSASTQQISSLATELFATVKWESLFCSAGGGAPGTYTSSVQQNGTWIPWLYNATTGCTDSFGPLKDGLYNYNEMQWLAWLAHGSVCAKGCSPAQPIEKFFRKWQGRAAAPNWNYAGRQLLTLWPSYVVQLPYYLVNAFNSDPLFTDLFAAQWAAEWAYFNSSALHAGEQGRYGLGAGPTAEWCSGTGYKADQLSNLTTTQTCRMYSPYAVAGYLPAAPALIQTHLLQLLAAGEAVLPVAGTEFFVLWRKSLLDPGWQPVPAGTPRPGRDDGYGLTLVDFAAEMFGLSTMWLGADFFPNNTNHWPR